jgi:arginyl-tRNA synthetase
MCEYVFDLSQAFSSFYEACPVLSAPDPPSRRARTALCLATEGE